MIPSRTSSSSTLLPTSRESDTASIRPRNRRLLTTQDGTGSPSAFSSPSRTPSRGASPIPSAHIGSVTGRNNAGTDVVPGTAPWKESRCRPSDSSTARGPRAGPLSRNWRHRYSRAGDRGLVGELHRPGSRDGSRARKPTRQSSYRAENRIETWGPQPPNEGRPSAGDIAAGSRAEREATLKAMRTASVLESHEGVNGGLDVARRFKKRSSDEDLRNTSQNHQETEAYLAYIHHVQATDTYAGVVLKYRCREDAFRKANGLWSRDNIQVRKWLAMPVDAYSHPHPIEVARVPRKALGYFPPRRKKSVSTVSTPRASMDHPNAPASESAVDSPGSSSSRRPSLLTSRRPSNSTTTSPANRRRINSTGSGTSASADDPRPAWMRRPGGVGSLGRNVRAPGPERDYFNTWTNKHLPGLNIDSLPSMSVMGSEMARFGFLRAADNPSVAIAESPIEDGRDATSHTTQQPQHQQGTSLDKGRRHRRDVAQGRL
ncbi:hypothetical protein CHGG_04702 [Chaetomium globosum CBS 148.51]|uniref:LysM domain-containing protein n=1 Tax=Chaetomium globosum (strain ATCC 6205 / CBS 148.51 / DSM 1962 / NBRC 6347 / NRRL 1970) TaxID=306901 RepID=Q2H0J4_CHAGB|nr:uncharacterized protein CHGG_04702 [Chaetomium globosum CBS 148.51]EAQ88083.1 hypothetical protein CHGG_04702 [Chaetomium globosum CBS 148.51]